MNDIAEWVARVLPDPDPLLVATIEDLGATRAEILEVVACLLDGTEGSRPRGPGARRVWELLLDALDDDEPEPDTAP